jgi:thiamine-monophosphate kinase
MNEHEILKAIRAKQPVCRTPRIVLGIGDDAAIYRPRSGEDLVFTTDMMHEGRHFLPDYPPDAVGWKALARSLSDLAAMGARPQFALLSLALGPGVGAEWVEGVAQGFASLAARSHTVLAGGDLSRAGHSCLEVMACGSVPKGCALRRDGARPGDRIFVSGRLGGGQLGLERPDMPGARQRHLRPQPRLLLGELLRTRGLVSSMMDLSDGLSIDLERLLLASGVAARLSGRLPRYPGATEQQALHGGDDYELLFTVGPGRSVPHSLAGTRLTHIGDVASGSPGQITFRGDALRAQGWDHFRDAS